MPGAHRLSALDASFLHLETPGTHMHIGGVAVFSPSPLGKGKKLFEAMLRHIEPRLDLAPRYRQKLAFVPLSLDVPVWVDDDDFDIRNHVLHAALPAPGGDEQLQEFCARVFSRQLDRRRPLWELYIIEGLKGGNWALMTKTHHGMVDGISNLELATLLLDTEPEAQERPMRVSRWSPSGQPSSLELLMSSLRERAGRPGRLLGTARAVAGKPRKLAAALRDTASGVAVMAQNMRAPKSPINGRTGPARRFMFSRFALDDFKIVKNRYGGTINDVVLSVVAGGLHKFLLTRGLDAFSREDALRALCPVSIRDTTDRSALGNRLAMMLVKLPTYESDPVRRLQAVQKTVEHLKASKQAVGADFLLNLAGFSPPTLHAMVARASIRQIGFNLLVTNVPGPQFPLYCQGSQLLEAFPIAFLYSGQQLAVAVFSYCGKLNFGYIADAEAIRDLGTFRRCMEESVAALVDAARAEPHSGSVAPAKKTRATQRVQN